MFEIINKILVKKQALKFLILGLLFFVGSVWLFGARNISNAASTSSRQNVIITVSSTVPFHCADSIQNFDETGVDCGGADCAACTTHCTNGIKDADETGVDCGGSLCSACPNHCTNGIKDADETGVDCGGTLCSSCGGGGGGGGGGGSTAAQINLSGIAYPNRPVTILKDGQIVATVTADNLGNFQQVFPNIPAGTYNFTVYAADTNGIRSKSVVFPITITSFGSITANNIIVPPTLTVDKSTVKKGDTTILFGQAAPSAEVSIYIKSADETGEQLLTKVFSGLTGAFSYSVDTKLLEYETYSVRAKEKIGGTYSDFSNYVNFTVGTETKPGPTGCPQKGDVNGDCRVNLVDFSIAAYWYKRPISDGFKKIEGVELSNDGKINITDFSIMAYYWTG